MSGSTRSVAIAHDQLRVYGGAERVAVKIARLFDAPIYTTYLNEGVVPDDVEVVELAEKRGKWLMQRHYMVQDAYQMLKWQHVPELYGYDIVIQTKTNPYWFVPREEQTVVRYCHSTPRGLYDQFARFGSHWLSTGLKTAQRMLYQQVVPYADRWVANSDLVARRINRYFGVPERHIDTVYPGVDVGKYGSNVAETGDYLFHVGRLATNKRVGLIRDIAASTDKRVVVAGTGREEGTLLDGAPDNLDYLGYISEDEKQRRLSEARGFLFFGENEDFGMAPVEALASGTPVIGVDEGFTRYQVLDGRNGYRCPPTVEDAITAIIRLYSDGVEWSEKRIEQFGQQFSWDRFNRDLQESVDRAVTDARIEPEIELPGPTQEVVADGGGG